jgi:hypothetical protein
VKWSRVTEHHVRRRNVPPAESCWAEEAGRAWGADGAMKLNTKKYVVAEHCSVSVDGMNWPGFSGLLWVMVSST